MLARLRCDQAIVQTQAEALGHVLQFAHVAGPVVVLPAHHVLRRPIGRGAVVAHPGLLQKVGHQQRDVLGALTQRRQCNRHDVQAVVQVHAELAAVGRRLQIHLGRRHHTAIDRYAGVAAQPLDAALLQRAQQLGLQCQRHRFDLVQKQRAAVGVFHLADAAAVGAGERTRLMTEHLALEHGLGQRRAIQRDERTAPPAAFVNGASEHFLTRAGLTGDEDVGVGRCQRGDKPAHVLHGRALADQRVRLTALQRRL